MPDIVEAHGHLLELLRVQILRQDVSVAGCRLGAHEARVVFVMADAGLVYIPLRVLMVNDTLIFCLNLLCDLTRAIRLGLGQDGVFDIKLRILQTLVQSIPLDR